ncbi:MAG: hypothetical protein IJZ15_03885 [Oscillospiraceae bacterium]|nr:hypothetical protein [Oscillospiraceae bacterium]
MNSKKKLKGAEIDLLAVLAGIWKKKYIIILVTIICAALMGFRSAYFLTPTYTASATLYANNSTETEDSTSISSGDMTASVKLVKSCGVIIKSAPVMEQVAKNLGVGTWELGSVNVYSVSETQVFNVDVTSTSPEMAAKVANMIAEVAPEQIASIVDGSSVKIINLAKVPTAKSWPSNRSEAMKGAVVGFAISLFAVCVITLLDTRIKNEDDLERWDYPILGVIPSFSASQKGGAYASASKGGKK